MDIQDLNMSLFNKAMSYLPGTNQFNERFKEYGCEADDEEIDTKEALMDAIIDADRFHTIEINFNGNKEWIEFKFDSTDYTLENLVEVLYCTYNDGKQYCYRYPPIDVEAMYIAYFK